MRCPNCGSEIPDDSDSCFICGAALVAQTEQLYSAARPNPQQQQQDAVIIKDKSPGKKFIPIIIIAAVLLVGLIVLISQGAFANKSGTYTSDQLEIAVVNYVEKTDPDMAYMARQMEYTCEIVIEGKKADLIMTVAGGGQSMEAVHYTGNVVFIGNMAVFTFDGQGSMVGKYNHSAKAITLSLEDQFASQYGVNEFIFKKGGN